MAIDPLREEILTFSQAAKRLPHLQRDRPIHTSTLWRWAKRGLRGIKLETTKVGGPRVTSTEARLRFFAALANADALPIPEAKPRPDVAVDQALDEIGS
jgi:hypothetical protein